LLLESGNALVGDMEPAMSNHGVTSVQAMNLLGYDAMALGSSDLGLGVDELRQRQTEAAFPFLSANVVAAAGELLATPYITRELGGLRVGVIGVSSESAALPDGLAVLDPVSAVARFVPEIERQGVRFIIVLSNAGRAADQRIAAEVPGVDWIAAGGLDSQTSEPLVDETNGVPIVQATTSSAGHAGLAIGVGQLVVDSDGRLSGRQWRSVLLSEGVKDDPDLAQWRLEQYKK
jgi:5'-nucleotidase/UDP-sugar diphosphatase